MAVTDPMLDWRDPMWTERGDNPWQRKLRLQQAWWRQTIAKSPAGPIVGGDRLVVSMLPHDVGWSPNLMSDEARAAAADAIESLRSEKRAGLIQEERLRRNLLSSQPMCFNLFGYLAAHPSALLPWVRTHAPRAQQVDTTSLEWSPADDTFGGSAFDAFIDYTTLEDTRGFIGVECKYAENPATAQRKPAAEKHLRATETERWRPGAAAALNKPSRRQFWYNHLLTQRVRTRPEYDEGIGIVLACAGDSTARQVTADVAAQLVDSSELRFATVEDLIASVNGHNSWRTQLAERYLGYASIEERA